MSAPADVPPRASSAGVSTADALLIAVGVLGVSTSGPLIAAMTAPALAVAFWRNAMSLAVLVPVAAALHRRELTGLPRRTLLLAVAAGVLLAGHFALWVPSLTMTTVASATALVCMQAVWTAVFARLMGHHVPRAVWGGMALALAGVLAVSGVDATLGARAVTGDLLALAGGVLSAAYVVAGAEVRRHASTTAYTTLCYGVCAVVLLAVCLVGGVRMGGYAAADWWRLAALTVAAQLLGHSVFNVVVHRVGPVLVSLCVLLEVPGAALLAALWLGQVPPLAAVPGVLLVLLGIAVVVRSQGAPLPADPQP